jgi:methionine salvage enolase-phosphatase E1
VRFDLPAHEIQAVVLDIEGTTTPVSFVYDVLFPFARLGLRSYLRDNLDAVHVREPLRLLREEWSEDMQRGARSPSESNSDRTTEDAEDRRKNPVPFTPRRSSGSPEQHRPSTVLGTT